MKLKASALLLIVLFSKITRACPVCEKQQPEFLQGITHGTGPQSNWDWVIIAIITLITAATLIFSIKYLIKPGEKNRGHIKQSILSY